MRKVLWLVTAQRGHVDFSNAVYAPNETQALEEAREWLEMMGLDPWEATITCQEEGYAGSSRELPGTLKDE